MASKAEKIALVVEDMLVVEKAGWSRSAVEQIVRNMKPRDFNQRLRDAEYRRDRLRGGKVSNSPLEPSKPAMGPKVRERVESRSERKIGALVLGSYHITVDQRSRLNELASNDPVLTSAAAHVRKALEEYFERIDR